MRTADLLFALHRPEVRHGCGEHIFRILGIPAGRAVVERFNRFAVITEHLPVRIAHRGRHPLQILVIRVAPSRPERLIRRERLTAGAACAHIRIVRVAPAASGTIDRIGARCDGLCPERLLVKGGRHLRRHNAHQIGLERPLFGARRIAVKNGDGLVGIRLGPQLGRVHGLRFLGNRAAPEQQDQQAGRARERKHPFPTDFVHCPFPPPFTGQGPCAGHSGIHRTDFLPVLLWGSRAPQAIPPPSIDGIPFSPAS